MYKAQLTVMSKLNATTLIKYNAFYRQYCIVLSRQSQLYLTLLESNVLKNKLLLEMRHINTSSKPQRVAFKRVQARRAVRDRLRCWTDACDYNQDCISDSDEAQYGGTTGFHLSHCARSVAFIFVKHLTSCASLLIVTFAVAIKFSTVDKSRIPF